MKKPKKPKSDLIIIPLMVVTFFVTYFICKQNLIEVFKNNTSNKDVKAPKKVAVEKLDINDLDQATIEESINSGSTIVPNEDNNVTEEDINNANTNTIQEMETTLIIIPIATQAIMAVQIILITLIQIKNI